MLADCLKLYTGGILSIQMIHAQPLRLMDTNRRLLHFYRHMMMVTKSFIFFLFSKHGGPMREKIGRGEGAPFCPILQTCNSLIEPEPNAIISDLVRPLK